MLHLFFLFPTHFQDTFGAFYLLLLVINHLSCGNVFLCPIADQGKQVVFKIMASLEVHLSFSKFLTFSRDNFIFNIKAFNTYSCKELRF